MVLRAILVVITSVLFLASGAQQGPISVDQVMQDAMQQAAKEKKNILIIFHASWCGWCRKMDSSIDDENCRKYFDENYVIRHLVVDESRDKKNLENPGADEFRVKYNGDNQGIPFWLIFDKNGNLLADSQMRPAGSSLDARGVNVGCPASEKEVAEFTDILKKTSRLKKSELETIARRFRKNEE